MIAPSEKRSASRTALHALVAFERTALGPAAAGETLPQGVGRDISPQGLSFLTDRPLFPGEVVRLHLPVGAPRSEAPVFSQVRWRRTTRHGYCVGLQFLA